MSEPRKIVICPADTHSGSPVGWMLPNQWHLGDGGYHNPTETQRIIHSQVEEVLSEIKPYRKRGTKIILVMVGDATEGDHHGTTQLVTKKTEEQERIHIASMDWFLKELSFSIKRGDELFYVEGTLSHVGQAAQSEERIARDMSATPRRLGTPQNDYKDGRYVWPRLRLSVNGVGYDIAHHAEVGAGTRVHTRGNALLSYLRSLYYTLIDSRAKVPGYWIRAHKHVYCHRSHEGKQGRIDGFLLPALQAKTEFGYKVAAGEVSSLGIWFSIVEPDGESFWKCPMIEYEADEVVTV